MTRTSFAGAAARSLLALAFGITAAVSPLSMISCPQHGSLAHAAHTTASADGHDPGEAAGPVHDTGDESGRGGDHEHDGPCCCLGHCCPGGSTAGPAGSDVLVHFYAARALPAADYDGSVRLTADPWSLPYPNGPPVVS